MWKIILTISLVLVIVLSFTACAKEPSAQEIVDGVIESFDNIRTYQFDSVMTQDMVGEAEGEVLEQIVAVDNSGTLDLENLQMSAELSMVVNMLAPEEDEIEQRVEMYIIDGMMYAKPEAPDIEEPMWTKNELPAEAWEMMKGISGLETYMELLETAQVEVIGSEKVKGIDCYVIQLTPEIAQLWQTLGAGGFSGGVPDVPTFPEELIQEVFSDFTVKQWIAKDTYFLMKVEIDTVMELTSEFMDYLGEEGEMSIDLTLNFLAYNYNQPVSIVLPPEAEEAIEVPME
jgi:outer membrane lipoprotein-sorting protein